MSQFDHLPYVLLNVAQGPGRPDLAARTHCANGHPFTPENIKVRGGTNRVCRTCIAERARNRRKRRNIKRNGIGGSLLGEWQGPKMSPEIRRARDRRRALEKFGEWQGPRLDPREYVDNIKRAGLCMDCGGKFHPVAMDFDHRPDEKKVASISSLVGRRKGKRAASVEKLIAELAKCDLVCANCHRVRTVGRLGILVETKTPPLPPIPVLHTEGHARGGTAVDPSHAPVRASVREFFPENRNHGQ